MSIWTGDSFVDGEMIASVKAQYGFESGLFDMEATAVCQAAELFDLPVVVIKMVSDVPEEGHSEHSYDEFADAHSDFTPLLQKLENLL
jgi:nucleoside phosphorylase